jgi:hypothetical protein
LNKLILALAVIADIALVVNIHRHWDDGQAARIETSCRQPKTHWY